MRRLLVTLALLSAMVLSACSLGGPPSLVGTWTGEYTYPSSSGAGKPSTETLVITKQEGSLVWGYEEWQSDGTTKRADLKGTISSDNRSFVLAEEGGWFEGTVSGDTMRVRYTRTDSSPTTFEVDLTRQ